MPAAASLYSYRTALALNNMAVDLLQRGRYEPALRSLNDSLSLMQAAFVLPIKKKMTDGQQLKDSHKDTLQKAYQRYVKSVGNPNEPNPIMEVDVEPVDDEDYAGLRAAAKYGPSSTIVFPVRISYSCNGDETDSAEIMARQFGTIVYNHGLANFLSSKQRGEGRTGKYLKRSYKSLRVAETTFLSLLEDEDKQEDAEEEEEEPQEKTEFSSILLAAMALNGMSVFFHTQDQPYKAEEAQLTVSILCSNFDEDCLTDLLVQRHTAAAA